MGLSLAYGKGSAYTTFKTDYISGGNAIKTSGNLNNIRISQTALTPFLGAKLELKRLMLGTEATIIHLNYTTQNFSNVPAMPTR